MANADPLPSPVTTVPQAPIGHLQPRAHQISPGAPAEEIEQQRLSTFDAEQQKLDQQLDKSLNIQNAISKNIRVFGNPADLNQLTDFGEPQISQPINRRGNQTMTRFKTSVRQRFCQ
jgi:hypothetical protein